MHKLEIKKIEKDNSIKLLFLGAVHGNEKCGTEAIRKIIAMFENGELSLKKGSISFVPICNQKAYDKNIRDVGVNLNRIIDFHEKPKNYEEEIGNQIAQEIQKADYLVDLHSYPAGELPSSFLDFDSLENMKLINASLTEVFVTEFPQMYEDCDIGDMSAGSFADSIGTHAITVECGNHYKQETFDFAFKLILNILKDFGMIYGASEKMEKSLQKVKMESLFIKEQEGSFSRNYRHLDKVSKGEIIAEYKDGAKIIAPKDSIIVLPHEEVDVGREWFYLGKVDIL